MTGSDDKPDDGDDTAEGGEAKIEDTPTEDTSVLEDDADGTPIPPAIVERMGPGLGRRAAGLLAAALGLIGCLLSFALLATSLRLIFVASDVADTAAEPLSAAVERLDTRIDQADDLIDTDGVSGTDYSELQARADGLVDITQAADRAYAAIDDHVIYRWLPVDKDDLGRRLERFSTGAEAVSAAVASGNQLSASAAVRAGDRVNEMQTEVSSVDDVIESTVNSLTNWIRLTGLAGLVASLWSLWAQIALMKRGWRGVKGEAA
ncbi:MAG: hypothetical protein OER95_11220 [Acidimicrobiia bacterium]|nr:hypothetical protein [Acidimicrobiia bacterium]